MIKAVIFDLDGVLVSTDMLHYKAWKKLADQLGIHNFTLADNVRQRGVSRMASLEVLLEKSNKRYSESEKIQLAEIKNKIYVESLSKLSEKDVLPGAGEVIGFLRKHGIKIALGSASKNAQLILEKTGLFPMFDFISSGLNTTRSKPDPEVFLVAAEGLEVKPEDCLIVEDSDAGIQAAKTGGMYAMAVGSARENPLADLGVESLNKIQQLFLPQ